MAAPPVVLKMEVCCRGCAKKIRKAIIGLDGVQKVEASPDTGLVVVSGTANASVLQLLLQYQFKRGPVTIVSAGAAEPLPPDWQRRNLHYAGRMAARSAPHHYQAAQPRPRASYYQYAHGPRYVPLGEPPVCFKHEKPNGGCCVQ